MNRVLVTGGCGFIGSEFVRQAIKRGYHVGVVDKLTYAGDLERLKNVQGKYQFYKTDICHAKALESAFRKFKPHIVIHFAAETHVDRSILYAETATKTNLLGTQVLVEAARKYDVKKFVYISTDEVYGEIVKGHFRETTALNPSSPYSAAKAAADMLIKAYMRTYQFPAVIVRPSNNYGPWQYPEKFMPVIIYKAFKNQKIPVYARGLNVREWLYVSDCAQAVMTVMEKGKIGEVYNIGSGNEQRNIDVVKKVLASLKKPQDLIEFVEDRPGHDIRYSLDFSKIRKDLGWTPKVSFEEGVGRTIKFYKENMQWLEKKAGNLKSYWKKVYKKSK